MQLIPPGAQPPATLYKYGGPRALEILQRRAIYLTRPTLFNDPFDTRPHHDTVFVSAASANPRLLDLARGAASDVLLRITNAVILSLSGNCENLLMWAHYGAAHTGVAIGFRGLSDILAGGSPHRAAGPVVYSPTRPSAPRHDQLTHTDVLLTKAEDWQHEEEWRIIDSHYSADVNEPDESGQRWAFNINTAAVREVVFGCRCDPNVELEALRLLRHPDYQHVTLLRACPDERHYQMQIVEWPRSAWPQAPAE